jgi:hypothetical protein
VSAMGGKNSHSRSLLISTIPFLLWAFRDSPVLRAIGALASLQFLASLLSFALDCMHIPDADTLFSLHNGRRRNLCLCRKFDFAQSSSRTFHLRYQAKASSQYIIRYRRRICAVLAEVRLWRGDGEQVLPSSHRTHLSAAQDTSAFTVHLLSYRCSAAPSRCTQVLRFSSGASEVKWLRNEKENRTQSYSKS